MHALCTEKKTLLRDSELQCVSTLSAHVISLPFKRIAQHNNICLLMTRFTTNHRLSVQLLENE